MADETLHSSTNCGLLTSVVSLSAALIVAIGALAYTCVINHGYAAQGAGSADVTGKLTVSYNVIISKTANTEESMGSTMEATRVQYFPNYVLVTTTNGVTHLWAVERIKKLEVSLRDGTVSQGHH
jgi:hypothetical protein